MLYLLKYQKGLFMYFDYNGDHFCVNCDWLQYSVVMDRTNPTFSCPPGYRIDLCQGNNIYEHRALVFDGTGRKLLTLLWKPYSSILDPLIMTVQIANESLYSGLINKSNELLRSILPCYFNAIGRFDICCDFLATDKRLNMVKHLNSGHYYVERKTEGSGFWHQTEKKGYKHLQHHDLNWGGKTTDIKVKLYNKSRELGLPEAKEPDKPWIINEWNKAGLDKTKVWRLEFSMKTNGQLEWDKEPIKLHFITSPMWLVDIFSDLYYKRFVCRINQGKQAGHKNNDKRVFLFDWPTSYASLNWAETKERECESEPAILLLRSMLRNLDNEALKADKHLFESYTTNICDVVNTHHLEHYFERCFGKTANAYFAELCEHAGSGINEHTVEFSKLID